MFGQKSGFGSSGFGSGGFGTNNSGFGSTSTSGGLFGNKSTTSGGLFGTSTPAFGANKTGFTFGGASQSSTSSGLFGTPTSSKPGGLFGTPAATGGTSAFGGNSAFGSTSSAFGQQKTGGLFGSTGGTSSFGSTTTGGGLFGFSSAQQQNGTGAVKFNPPTGTDTMMRSGQSSTISTKHQCITAMKEYEAKSFEELRVDDYTAGRKGGSANKSAFGASSGTGFSFGGATNNTTTSGGLFGQKQTGFGSGTTGGLFGSSTSSTGGSLFGNSGFGSTNTATTSGAAFGGFGQNMGANSLFGQSKPNAGGMFGNTNTGTTTGGMFGNTSTSGGFGSTGGFGGTSGFGTNSNNLFGNKTGVFGTASTQAGSTGFGGGGSLFGSNNKTTTGMFGNTTGGFGTGNASGSLFGGNKTAGFGNTSGSLFGNTGNTSGGLFGGANKTGFGTSNLGGGFGASNTGFGNASSGFNFGGTGGTNAGSGFGNANNAAANNQLTLGSSGQSSAEIQQQLQALLTAPFGDSPLFKNPVLDPARKKEVLKPTNPAAQKAVVSPLYRVSPGPTTKIKPKALQGGLSNSPALGKNHDLFAGLRDEEESVVSNRSFIGRKSVKKLSIKVTASPQCTLTGSATPTGERSSSRASSASGEQQHEINGRGPGEETPAAERRSSQGRDERETIPYKLLSDENDQSNSRPTPSGHATNNMDDTMMALNVRARESDQQKEGRDHFGMTLDKPAQSAHDPGETFVKKVWSPDTKRRLEAMQREQDSMNEDDQQISTEPSPAHIKLTRSGYYTIPSMEELGKCVMDGQCLVTDFTIGRKGYGSVFFPGTIDLYGIDLDEIVHIRRKEVIVYPDDDDKPALNEGLNRKAEVTLDMVWPSDKTTREPITDPERISLMGWEHRLEQTTAKMGARFIEYRPDTGSWVFLVNHFSKYGLSDSDEEGDENIDPAMKLKLLQQKLKQQQQQQKGDVTMKTGLQKPKPAAVAALIPKHRQPSLGGIDLSEEEFMESEKNAFAGEGGDITTPKMIAPMSEDNDRMMGEYDQNETERQSPGVIDVLPASQRMAYSMEINTQSIQVMKASFFGDDELSDGSVDNQHQEKVVRSPRQVGIRQTKNISPANVISPGRDISLSVMKSQKTIHGIGSTLMKSQMSPVHQIRKAPMKAPQTAKAPTVVSMKRFPSSVSINRTIITGKHSCVSDSGLYMGRRFRVGWGPNWSLVHSGIVGASGSEVYCDDSESSADSLSWKGTDSFSIFSADNRNQNEKGFQVKIEKVQCAPHLYNNTGEATDVDVQFLRSARLHAVMITPTPAEFTTSNISHLNATENEESVTCPQLCPSDSVNTLNVYADVAKDSWQKTDRSHPDSGTVYMSHLALGLCQALWGNMYDSDMEDEAEEKQDCNPYVDMTYRKNAVTTWLIEAIKDDDRKIYLRDTDDDDGCLREIYLQMTSGELDKAVETALKTGNMRLALLLAQTRGSQVSRVAIAKQLMTWEEMKADQHISDTAMKIYSLIAGKAVWHSSRGRINACEGVDWKRCFLIHLLYIAPPTSPIQHAVELYNEAWQGKSELGKYCVAPAPPHIERESDLEELPTEHSSTHDICFHLIQLYCNRSHNLDSILSSGSSVPYPLDLRVSWRVFCALHVAGYHLQLQPTSRTSLHVAFASQLAALDLWQYAAMVLMHIENSREREIHVKNLLGYHLMSSTDDEEKEDFLRSSLAIPNSWLSEAKALRSRFSEDKYREAEELVNAQRWRCGHDVIMRHIAADALIDDYLPYLRSLLEQIQEGDQASLIPNWEFAGKVYLDYIIINNKIQQLQESDMPMMENGLEELQQAITSLCHRVARIETRNARDRLAKAEMGKQILNLYQIVQSLQHQSDDMLSSMPYSGTSSLLEGHIEQLRLPEDYAIEELKIMVRNHLTTHTSGDDITKPKYVG
ncbi:nuclear pore complex protein Nup98-Nup96-like [Styela clava]